MILGIVGDTHNNLKNISKICEIFNEKKVNLVIHTGDITLPKSLEAFKNLNSKIIGVFGNNDIEEKEDLLKICERFKFSFNNEPYFIRLENKNIGIVHHPELIDEDLLNKSDIIFHGHTHRYRAEMLKETLIFNPGECAGFMEGKNQVGILDLKNLDPKVVKF